MLERIVLAIVLFTQAFLVWSNAQIQQSWADISESRRKVDAVIIENTNMQIELARQWARVLGQR